MKLTVQEFQNLFAFLNRVQIQGSEAEALVMLRAKLNAIYSETDTIQPAVLPPLPDETPPTDS